ncbi:hypothetical protein GGR50DRAFT_504883 [Xylaria sp. CBS 124048]|nr:hypothetical protein GGR50DRAFT_504883 [Xylaria sp. CBS 124048]
MEALEVVSISSGDPSPSGSEASDSEVGVDEWKHELHGLLNRIETSGAPTASKQYSRHPNPGLQIGSTLVTVPVDPGQVDLIRNAARQAPFGRGEETIVDTSVRNTWEISTSGFRIVNPAWATFVAEVVQHVAESLGVPGATAELYKLLLYEEGSFFKPHKDSEKAPGMIATLSLCLPSRHKGGEVHLSHAGKKYVFDTSQAPFDVTALAWFSDVTHEIKPILEGHRLVLIYNIIRTNNGASSARSLVRQDQMLQGALAKLNTRDSTLERLLYFLEFKYSQANLRMDHLKGRDRAICHALRAACTNNGWYLFLANVTKRRLEDDEDPTERYSDEEEDSMDTTLIADTIATCSGDIVVSHVELRRGDILGPNPYADRAADSESEGSFTGNESTPSAYKYHDSAVIIVPKNRLDDFLSYRTEVQVLVDLVIDDFMTHPNDSAIRRVAVDFLPKAVGHYGQRSNVWPSVLAFAWKMKEDKLYDDVVRAGFSIGTPEHGVILALAGLVESASERPIDWDKRFGVFVSNHHSHTKLSESLELIKNSLRSEDLRTSFQQWRSRAHILNFERKKTLVVEDHDAVLSLAGSQRKNVDWIQNVYIPKVRDRSDKNLISQLICSLLQRGREGVLKSAKDMASTFLEARIQELRLATIQLNYAADPKGGPEKDRFCQLLDACTRSGLHESVDELLRLSLNVVNQGSKNGDQPRGFAGSRPPYMTMLETQNPVGEMLRVICRDFEQHKRPPSGPARDFVITVLKKHVIANLPSYPQLFQGLAHQPRGCGNCEYCAGLDAFLASQTEREIQFVGVVGTCTHLQSLLPTDLFQCTRTMFDKKKKPPQYLFKVFKLHRQNEVLLERYMNDLRPIVHKVHHFRTEYMKELLGSEAYGEFVMLDQVHYTGAVVAETQGQSGTGFKRSGSISMALPAAKR